MSALERGDGWLRVGPLLFTTRSRYEASSVAARREAHKAAWREGRNAMEVGYELGRSGEKLTFTDPSAYPF